METESGFFSLVDAAAAASGDAETFHDFREIYASKTGFARLLLAKKQGRLFVVKSLKAAFVNDSVARTALRKEYETAFRVDSPYVARTFDFIDLAGFGRSIVMEYCAGESLADRIDKGMSLTDDDVEHIVLGLLHGLEDIHSRGIVHRDIKPGNIVYSSATRSLKIIDFGLAHSGEHYVLDAAAGTRGYESPAVHRPDYKASTDDDYYSAGMTLSAISPLCTSESRRKLAKIIRELTCKRRLSLDKARSLLARRRPYGRIIAAVAVVAVVAVAVLLLRGGKEEVKVIEPTVEQPKTEKSKNEEPKTETEEPKLKNPVVEQPAPEDYPPVNGVTFDEARLSKNFKSSDFDYYVVLRTDTYLTGCVLTELSSSATPEEIAEARQAFESWDTVWATVSSEVVNKFNAPDMGRAEGLAMQRYIFWTRENYRPLTVELAQRAGY